MSAVMTVDLSELDAWSAQVQRASDDLTGVSRNGSASLVQTDFGPILETMMGAYHSLLPSITKTLEDNGTGMHDHGEALKATARDFVLTESGVVTRHQASASNSWSQSTRFFDVRDTTIRRARPTETTLPQVTFGFPYDTVCDLIRMFTGFDIRAELAEKIGGDVVGASSQGSSFGCLGNSMFGVAGNLKNGSSKIADTWSGTASQAAVSQMGTWVGRINEQAGQLVQMGQNIVNICRDAWQTAKAVVECIRSAVQTVSSALATASIPGVGWARIARAVMRAYQAVMKAYKAITKLINILKQLKSLIEAVKGFFDGDSAPKSTSAVPTLGAAPSSVTRDPRTIATPTVGARPPTGGTAPTWAPSVALA